MSRAFGVSADEHRIIGGIGDMTSMESKAMSAIVTIGDWKDAVP